MNVAQALRTVYRAADATAGQAALDAFAQSPWGIKYPAIAQSWRRNWELVIPFFAFPEGMRRIIYTTDEMDKPFVFGNWSAWRREKASRMARATARVRPAPVLARLA